MGAVEGFFRLWDKTRATYGEGTPQTGEQFDHSAILRELETQLESTAPGDQWTGTAADAYGAVNAEHRRVIGELANLDQRLGAQVTKSAQVVTAGRDDLENLRYRVAAIAARLPEGTAGDAMRYTLVRDGTSQLTELVRRSISDLNIVGAEIDRIGNEYAALGNQKFGGGPKNNGAERQLEKDSDPEPDASEGANAAASGSEPGEPGGPEFAIGPPTKPDIEWDEDFEYGSEQPSVRDYVSRAEWEAKLAAARLIRPDLDDATQMYAHYWGNSGEPLKFDYEEAYREDPAVRANVEDQISRAQRGAEGLLRAGNTSFSMTGDASPTQAYPVTENWQKSIGAYQQWSSADVQVDGNTVTMTITVHAEDRYNFNRGQADIATGAGDNENGRFTELGWARPFDSYGEITRTVTWELGDDSSTQPSSTPEFSPGREDRSDGRGSSGGSQRPANDRDTGSVSLP